MILEKRGHLAVISSMARLPCTVGEPPVHHLAVYPQSWLFDENGAAQLQRSCVGVALNDCVVVDVAIRPKFVFVIADM